MDKAVVFELPEFKRLKRPEIQTLINARSYKQFADMIEAYLSHRCLFCDPLPGINKVIRQNMTHRLWLNPFPAAHTYLHLIIAPIKHVCPWKYTRHMHADLGELKHWALNNFLPTHRQGGGFLERFGNPEYNAGTILHHHINMIIPDLFGEVRLPLLKSVDDQLEAIDRSKIFYKLYRGTEPGDLTRSERKLIKGRM